jgi:Uncharacterized protein conserved in bacteria C-term(DUF2220)
VTLSLAARHVLAVAGGIGRRRVDREVLRAALWEVEPHLATSPAKRERLRAVIDELTTAGHVTLPRGRDLYDRTAKPPLPRYVTLADEAERARRLDAARYPWPRELRWATALQPPPSLDDMEVLEAVAKFITEGGRHRPVVPMQERSLALFRNEKRLDALRGGRLFADGRLTLDLLRCQPAPPPFVYTPLSDRWTMFVVENSAAYATFSQLLGDGLEFGVVAYGAGKHFAASVAFALELSPRPARILYFGDLDVEGLSTPARASERAVVLGLPRVEPAEVLYDLMLAQRSHPVQGRRRRIAGAELEWLPERLRQPAAAVLASGRRIPQEAVGFELLSGDPSWRSALAMQLVDFGPLNEP